jgi:hypothetical protein
MENLAAKSEPLEIARCLEGWYVRSWHRYVDFWNPSKLPSQSFWKWDGDTVTLTCKNGIARYRVVQKGVDGHDWWIAELVGMETPEDMTTKINFTFQYAEDRTVRAVTVDQFPEYIWMDNEVLDAEETYVLTHDNEEEFTIRCDNGWATYRRQYDDEGRDQTFCKRLAWHLD